MLSFALSVGESVEENVEQRSTCATKTHAQDKKLLISAGGKDDLHGPNMPELRTGITDLFPETRAL